jgi:hypothetical protein
VCETFEPFHNHLHYCMWYIWSFTQPSTPFCIMWYIQAFSWASTPLNIMQYIWVNFKFLFPWDLRPPALHISAKQSQPLTLSDNSLCTFLVSLMCFLWQFHHICLDIANLTMLDEDETLWSFSLCNLLQSHVTSLLLSQWFMEVGFSFSFNY